MLLIRQQFRCVLQLFHGQSSEFCHEAIVHHDMQLKRSTYEVLQILSISLTDKTHLRDLFDKTIFNDVKELEYPLFKGLFD